MTLINILWFGGFTNGNIQHNQTQFVDGKEDLWFHNARIILIDRHMTDFIQGSISTHLVDIVWNITLLSSNRDNSFMTYEMTYDVPPPAPVLRPPCQHSSSKMSNDVMMSCDKT